MAESILQRFPSGKLVALAGNPNCGKTALFNLLTGSRQKVANYAGVTVERKEGRLTTPSNPSSSASEASAAIRILDLPGTYSLSPRSPDEQVTCDVLRGLAKGERRPDLVVSVVDATNLRRTLKLTVGILRMGLPTVVALNMVDAAISQGIISNGEDLARKLQLQLGVSVIATSGVSASGADQLKNMLADKGKFNEAKATSSPMANVQNESKPAHEVVQEILTAIGLAAITPNTTTEKIDRVLLHPLFGPAILFVLLFVIFQAVFAWATLPMELIKSATAFVANTAADWVPKGWFRSLLIEGIIAGIGGVLVFLPQIIILFTFILVLEESGYLPRAAFLLDRIMGSVGLSGRSFIPLLSSFACAIPGIMATRTIADPRDRMVTMFIAPLMTCSARLPVYALLIGAFIPQKTIASFFELQGLVLFALYIAGIAGAMGVAWVLKQLTSEGKNTRPLMMELPSYHWPILRQILLGLWQRVVIFMRRVGGIILILTIALWFLSSVPGAPPGAVGAPIEYSIAGMIGKTLELVFSPIGFNWQICIALVPGMAAREVAVSSLATVYALSASGEEIASALSPIIAQSWGLPTALSLLAWYVFAPQCLSTLAVVKRETGSWKMPIIMASYLFALAYLASFITYRVALAFAL